MSQGLWRKFCSAVRAPDKGYRVHRVHSRKSKLILTTMLKIRLIFRKPKRIE